MTKANAARFASLWLVGALALAPIHGAGPAIGSGLIAALVGAMCLYAGRNRADHGLPRAALAVAVFCAVLWFGQFSG